MLELIRMISSMASPYNALQIWVKHFLGYLVYELFLRPKSWRGSLYIYLLSFLRFWTVLIFILIYFEWRETETQQNPSKRDSTLIRAFLFYKIYIQKSLYTETWANRMSRPSGSFLETWVPYHSICNTTLACKFIKD